MYSTISSRHFTQHETTQAAQAAAALFDSLAEFYIISAMVLRIIISVIRKPHKAIEPAWVIAPKYVALITLA